MELWKNFSDTIQVPVIIKEPNNSSQASFSGNSIEIGNGWQPIEKFNYEKPIFKIKLTYEFQNIDDKKTLYNFFSYTLKGKEFPAIVPTFHKDLVLYEDYSAGNFFLKTTYDSTILIKEYQKLFLFNNETKEIVRVKQYYLENDYIYFELYDSFSTNILKNNNCLSKAFLMRSDQDTISFTMVDINYGKVTFSFKELVPEEWNNYIFI